MGRPTREAVAGDQPHQTRLKRSIGRPKQRGARGNVSRVKLCSLPSPTILGIPTHAESYLPLVAMGRPIYGSPLFSPFFHFSFFFFSFCLFSFLFFYSFCFIFLFRSLFPVFFFVTFYMIFKNIHI